MTTSRAIINAIYRNSSGCYGTHPLGGQTVREFVQEARKGWPKVPVPKDPAKAAQKLTEKHSDITYEEQT